MSLVQIAMSDHLVAIHSAKALLESIDIPTVLQQENLLTKRYQHFPFRLQVRAEDFTQAQKCLSDADIAGLHIAGDNAVADTDNQQQHTLDRLRRFWWMIFVVLTVLCTVLYYGIR